MEDEFGAWQSQTIRPAFRVEEPLNVYDIDSDDDMIEVEGNNIIAPSSARIFNMQGMETSHTNLAPGIYLISFANECHKVVIK